MLPRGSISKIREYYFTNPKFKKDVLNALRVFYDMPNLQEERMDEMLEEDNPYFNEWFIYDYILENGNTVLKDYYEHNPHSRSIIEMQLYNNLIETNKYGIFEVVKKRDNDKQYEIKDYPSTIFQDYIDILELLKDFYKLYDPSKYKKIKDYEKRIKEREKELDQSIDYDNFYEKMDEVIREKEMEDFRNDPAKIYYDYLKRFKINFSTKTLTSSVITEMGNGTTRQFITNQNIQEKN